MLCLYIKLFKWQLLYTPGGQAVFAAKIFSYCRLCQYAYFYPPKNYIL